MTRHGHGEGEAAGFERSGWICAFFFEECIGMAAAGKHGSPTLAKSDGTGFGEDGTIAPHARPGGSGGIAGNSVACSYSVQRLQIVSDVEGTFALRAEGLGRRGGNGGLATRTFQILDRWHEGNDNRWREREIGFGKCRRS